MPKIEAGPGEFNAGIISSIINLVCPQCGGACWNFNAMADAAGTGWLNGSGQTQNSWDPPLKSLNSKLIVTICNSEQNGVTPASACFLG